MFANVIADPQSVEFVYISPACVSAFKIPFVFADNAAGYGPHGRADGANADDLTLFVLYTEREIDRGFAFQIVVFDDELSCKCLFERDKPKGFWSDPPRFETGSQSWYSAFSLNYGRPFLGVLRSYLVSCCLIPVF